jgi:hypothetical protein
MVNTSIAARRQTGDSASASARLFEQAIDCAQAVVAQGAEAVALVGSVARGEANDGSDIDLLVVAEEPLRVRELILPEVAVECAFTTWRRLAAPGARTYAFLATIAPEARILYDPGERLATAFTNLPAPSLAAVKVDFAEVARKLDMLTEIERFGGLYLSVFADCYRYAKGAVVAACVHAGEPHAQRDEAFAWLLRRHRECANDIEVLKSIEPHYLLTMGKASESDLPFPARDCDDRARSVVAAAQRIAAVAASEGIASRSADL